MVRRKWGVPAGFYILAAGVFFAAVIAIVVAIQNLTLPINRDNGTTQEFEIEKGESVKSVAERLEQEKLIRHAYGFRIAVKQAGLGNKIQAGVYQLAPSMSASEIAQALTRGLKDQKVTIPEGYRIEQIAETVESALSTPAAEVVTAAEGKEGYLFPDTYFLAKGTPADKVISVMSNTFTKKTEAIKPAKEDIILASLVERETKTDEEKPIVAGILKKRLANGWPLQLDATMQYIVGKKGQWWPNTTLAEREIKSPYNTYLNRGLPPGPICNPGLESIKAVMNPEESEYWYYLHGRDGKIRYAKTSAEHEANIEEFIR